MRTNPFGTTGLHVTLLGLGTSQVGSPDLPDKDAARVLNHALDLGLNVIDTAHCYGISEERIGRHVGHRRAEYVLSSKCGHAMPGLADWTPACVRASVHESLRRLRTDRIDVVHLHSCGAEFLTDGRLADALDRLRADGSIGVVAYSGDNDALAYAIDSGRFASVEASVNIVDQHNLRHVVPDAARAGLGVIAKRPIANGIWRRATRPTGEYGDHYWDRLQALAYDTDLDLAEFALRFSAFAPGVSTAILGTTNPDHLTRAAAAVANGPLPAEVLAHVARRWDAVGAGWPSMR